ncbi:hypothetical protein MSKOL_1634 [Methanosarcina sp. Kolksee]|uniref:hypothetical protein n=1 Tax=Methanosarcina sp. Kolksee TaxID=1434099 RepID=UPI000615F727|nr:hypothetical protein [Methanosarcina sp. Kolksee]AKB47411.1 hypothetical protein MSKOL_1634 [Methanosarcina sp. Kolksee]
MISIYPDTLIPGDPDPKPCAICSNPVYSELQQDFTEDEFGIVLCCDCEYSFFWEAHKLQNAGFTEKARIYRDFANLHIPQEAEQ